ncbi:LacI family transcriptional regulator [Bacillus cereus]|uniref:LacI family transcriptional regulator n=1 Tax=Bacillus cereus TaxID=1396 RepID=UPI000B4AE059|nr:LacI family transcriptional regulator [Bacillus cereus]
MFKSKFKKTIGVLGLTSALFISAMPASADSGEIWVRNKYPNAYDIVFDAKNKTVMVYERDENGNIIPTFERCAMVGSQCFVPK